MFYKLERHKLKRLAGLHRCWVHDEGPSTFVWVGLVASIFPCTDTFRAAAVPPAVGFDGFAGSALDASALGDVTAAALYNTTSPS